MKKVLECIVKYKCVIKKYRNQLQITHFFFTFDNGPWSAAAAASCQIGISTHNGYKLIDSYSLILVFFRFDQNA